jgi:hypothetical protein
VDVVTDNFKGAKMNAILPFSTNTVSSVLSCKIRHALTAGMIPVLFQQWQAETVKKIHDTHTELCLTSIRKDLKLSADMTNDELLSALTN